MICPLCKREMNKKSKHHLIPKAKKGLNKETVFLHRICHEVIHRTFTNSELKKEFNTIEKILMNADIQVFVNWIKNKPVDFYQPMKSRRN